MKKLLTVAFLSVGLLALHSGPARAWCGLFHCCCNKCCTICCKPYNAFSPVCWGSICCDGCCPIGNCCQQPCCGPICGPDCCSGDCGPGCCGGSCAAHLPPPSAPLTPTPAAQPTDPGYQGPAPMPATSYHMPNNGYSNMMLAGYRPVYQGGYNGGYNYGYNQQNSYAGYRYNYPVPTTGFTNTYPAVMPGYNWGNPAMWNYGGLGYNAVPVSAAPPAYWYGN